MHERIDHRPESAGETTPILPVTIVETQIDVPTRAEDDFNEVIRSLETDKCINMTRYITPYPLGILIAMCAIAGIVIAKTGQQYYRILAGAQLADDYNQSVARTDVPELCGTFFPLNNTCDHLSYNRIVKPYLNGNSVTNSTMFRIATDCYYNAMNRCDHPEEFGIPTQSWPKTILWISCVSLAVACLALFVYFLKATKRNEVAQCRESTQTKLDEMSEKYGVNIENHATIKDTLSTLKKNKEIATRPARRRAFLSCGLPQHIGTSAVAGFFNKVPPEKPAPREIKEIILNYADLIETPRLTRG